METQRVLQESLKRSFWKGLLGVFVAVLLLAASSVFQFISTRKALSEEASKRAFIQLQSSRNQIMDVIDQAETAVRNSIWIAQWCLDYPDSLPRVSWRVVNDNPGILGSTVALVPGFLPRRPLYSPYVVRTGDSLSILSLATPEYDYPSKEWFIKPIEKDGGHWSEPYVDKGGGEVRMTTFSMPVKDRTGRTAAVLTGDISLGWLSKTVGDARVYPHATNLLISREGGIMVSPSGDTAGKRPNGELLKEIHANKDFDALSEAMLAGGTGSMRISYGGRKSHAYFAPVDRLGWSMCIIVPDDDVFGDVRRVSRLVNLLQLLGLAMLVVIVRFLVRSQFQYRDLNERRKRMGRELQIASGIQQSMVPTVFPERADLDMAATIVPAKEVGGDLYDFFIRDDKLFFCIGDVSGKGIPSSLLMAVTRTSFRNLSAKEDRPGIIVSAMNDSLSSMNENNMFVTFFCGVLDLRNGFLRYCNAGHNPPLTLTDEIRQLKVEPNLPLGIIHGYDYVEQETLFRYDDAILLYTDGITEAENARHEQFGEERLKAALHGRKPSKDHQENIKRQVSLFVGDAPQSDDLTLLFIHYMGQKKFQPHRLTLRNDIRQINLLPGFIQGVLEGRESGPVLTNGLNLALEESVTNVIMYAYPEGTEGTLDIDAQIDGNTVTFVISDSGKAFDPTARKEVDIDAGIDERPVGGLGIHLVRTIMDSVRYERKDGRNILTLTKNI